MFSLYLMNVANNAQTILKQRHIDLDLDSGRICLALERILEST